MEPWFRGLTPMSPEEGMAYQEQLRELTWYEMEKQLNQDKYYERRALWEKLEREKISNPDVPRGTSF